MWIFPDTAGGTINTAEGKRVRFRSLGITIFYVLLIGVALLLPPAAHADDDLRSDHEQAKSLLDAGKIMPLADVIKLAQLVHPGRVLDVELHHEDEHDGYVYELELIAPDGTVWEIELNAVTGRIIESERGD